MKTKSDRALSRDREISTIIAALRYWQREGLMSAGHEGSIACNGGDIVPLTAEEIDELCERLNFAPDELLEWRKELHEEIGGMGFDDPDQAVDGGDAVEYLGKLYDDLGQMIEKP